MVEACCIFSFPRPCKFKLFFFTIVFRIESEVCSKKHPRLRLRINLEEVVFQIRQRDRKKSTKWKRMGRRRRVKSEEGMDDGLPGCREMEQREREMQGAKSCSDSAST